MDILNNPLVIGISVTVIGGLILYHIFGIGKTKNIEQTIKDNDLKQKNIVENATSSLVQDLQKQKFEENRRNHSDPRNSNR